MIEYDFHNEAGELVTLELPPATAPRMGETITVEGEDLRRIVAIPAIGRGRKPPNKNPRKTAACRAGSIVSHSLPKWHPGADGYTAEGRPCYETERRLDEKVVQPAQDEGGDMLPFIDR